MGPGHLTSSFVSERDVVPVERSEAAPLSTLSPRGRSLKQPIEKYKINCK
jgi:hypothetical protein